MDNENRKIEGNVIVRESINQNNPILSSGPYKIHRSRDGVDDLWSIYPFDGDRPITSIPFWNDVPEWAERAKTTATLFAAAPRMLWALFEALEHLRSFPETCDRRGIRKIVERAISIASGIEEESAGDEDSSRAA